MDCNHVQKVGLLCQFGKGNWKDILDFKRPTIMEFSFPGDIKRYALLTEIKAGQPVFRFDLDKTFPLAEVLSFWDGYYLLIWQLPKPGVKVIVPGQTSVNVAWLRQQLIRVDGIDEETSNPQFFDEALKARVVKFQKTHHLTADGKVGLQTLFHLDNATGANGSPKLKD
jgi:general secretion pathway protein A